MSLACASALNLRPPRWAEKVIMLRTRSRAVAPARTPNSGRQAVALTAALVALLAPGTGWAQPATATPLEPTGSPPDAPVEVEPSPEELAEIEAALGADAAARAEAGSEEPSYEASGAASGSTAAMLLPDISLVLDLALAAFSDEDNLQSGAHDPAETGVNLQQLELSLGKSVDPYFRFDSNIVFSLSEIEVEEAYVTTMSMPWNLQARFGQFLTRFGRINSTHPHAWDFADQPIAVGKVFGAEGNRGLGAELSLLAPLPWYVELVFASTDARGEASARSFGGDSDGAIDSPLDFQHTLALKQFFDLSEDVSLLFGMSAANGPNPTGVDTRTDVYGADLYLKYRPITVASYTEVSLQVEGMVRRRQVPGDLLTDALGYAQLGWRFAKRWRVAGRYEYASSVRGEDGSVAVDPLDPDQVGPRHRGSTSLSFMPTEFSRVRIQGSSDLPSWRDRAIWAGFLTLEVVVGSHGAHSF